MPVIRPFRALRYDPATVGDLSAVICPPYDVISPEERARLLARDPRNAVRLELAVGPGEAEEGYEQAAATLRSWRSSGILRLDEEPSLYLYEQRFRLTGDPSERVQLGLFGRVHLEPFGQGVRPHERTLTAPKEDRLRLLRATRTNTSPIIVLAEDALGEMEDGLRRPTLAPPTAEATDDAGVRHRLWGMPEEGAAAASLVAAMTDRPLTVADGHHRYETALRYQEEQRAAGQAERSSRVGAEQAHDFVLALVLPVASSGDSGGRPTILPTHRLVLPRPGKGDRRFRPKGWLSRADRYFTIFQRTQEELVRSFSPPLRAGGSGRFGLLNEGNAFELFARREEIEPLFGSEVPVAVRELDVAVLEATFASLIPRLAYTHVAADARRAVESGEAEAAFLLEPTPVEDVLAVAAAGAVMPQKSTYFYPKVATGLVMYPFE